MNNKIVPILLFTLLTCVVCKGQTTLSYTYDSAGNRIARTTTTQQALSIPAMKDNDWNKACSFRPLHLCHSNQCTGTYGIFLEMVAGVYHRGFSKQFQLWKKECSGSLCLLADDKEGKRQRGVNKSHLFK